MKAAVLFATNQPLKIIELTVPELQAGQVLVKIYYSGICHSQIMEMTGQRGEDPYLPHLLGHEGVGEVLAVGEGVSKVIVGDRVILGWIKGQGLDAPGGIYQYDGQQINSGGVTTFAEQSIVAENRVVKLPPELPLKLAVLFGCALPTGAGLVLNQLRPQPQSSIAIFGLGGIGLSALIACQLFAPKHLIVVDVNPEKLLLAQELGATTAIQATQNDPLIAIQTLLPEGVDYAIEAAGLTSTIEQAFASVKEQGGRCIFASHPAQGTKICLEPHAFHRGKQIQGSWGGQSQPDTDIPKLAALYQEKKLPLEKLFSTLYTLEEINQGVKDLQQQKVIRPLIKICPPDDE